MMQALGIAVFASSILLMLAIAVVILPAVFSFRPFDYRKVGYRAGVLFALAMPLMMLGASLHDGHLSPVRLETVVEVFVMMLIGVLIASLISYVNYRGMRSLSATYAEREAALAERKRRREGRDDVERTQV